MKKPQALHSPARKLVDIESFGGWDKVQPEHFGDGGIFAQIYQR